MVMAHAFEMVERHSPRPLNDGASRYTVLVTRIHHRLNDSPSRCISWAGRYLGLRLVVGG
jgi:hypothetical protein